MRIRDGFSPWLADLMESHVHSEALRIAAARIATADTSQAEQTYRTAYARILAWGDAAANAGTLPAMVPLTSNLLAIGSGMAMDLAVHQDIKMATLVAVSWDGLGTVVFDE